MIQKLASDIKDFVDLNWLEKKHGLVFSNDIIIPGAKKKTLPFEWGVKDCTENSCVTMNDKYRCVSWIEGGNVINSGTNRMESGVFLHDTEFRMVCWVNLNKIDKDDVYVADKCIATLEQKLSGIKFNNSNYQVLHSVVKRIVMDPKQILSKYNFDDKVKLMLHPHMVFAVDFVVGYTAKQCAPITLNPTSC